MGFFFSALEGDLNFVERGDGFIFGGVVVSFPVVEAILPNLIWSGKLRSEWAVVGGDVAAWGSAISLVIGNAGSQRTDCCMIFSPYKPSFLYTANLGKAV